MLRPSEMLVAFLLQLQDAGFCELYYQNFKVDSIEHLEYDKFIIRRAYANDEEIRCDGLMTREFLAIVKDFEIK